MGNKITDFPDVTLPLSGNEYVELAVPGLSSKVKVSDLASFGGGGGGSATVAVGTIVPMLATATEAAPTGYLWCDGSIYNQSAYADLYASIGLLENYDPALAGTIPTTNGLYWNGYYYRIKPTAGNTIERSLDGSTSWATVCTHSVNFTDLYVVKGNGLFGRCNSFGNMFTGNGTTWTTIDTFNTPQRVCGETDGNEWLVSDGNTGVYKFTNGSATRTTATTPFAAKALGYCKKTGLWMAFNPYNGSGYRIQAATSTNGTTWTSQTVYGGPSRTLTSTAAVWAAQTDNWVFVSFDGVVMATQNGRGYTVLLDTGTATLVHAYYCDGNSILVYDGHGSLYRIHDDLTIDRISYPAGLSTSVVTTTMPVEGLHVQFQYGGTWYSTKTKPYTESTQFMVPNIPSKNVLNNKHVRYAIKAS